MIAIQMWTWLIYLVLGVELCFLVRMLRVELRRLIDAHRAVAEKTFQAVDNANQAIEKIEDAAGDVAVVTEQAKDKSSWLSLVFAGLRGGGRK